MIKVDPEILIQAGAHFGHQTRRWNPKMKNYLFGEENGVHIFDLIKTKELLENALEFITKSAREGKTMVFVGTKKQTKEKIKEVAQSLGQFYVCERWLGGTLTNFEQIKKTLRYLDETKEKKLAGEFKAYTKKENLLIDRDIERMERFFGGLRGMTKMPDLMFIVDIKKEFGALREANKLGIKTIAIVDSNCDPTLVDYEIPMNDDATRAISYVLDLVSEAFESGKKVWKKAEDKKEKSDNKQSKSKKE